MSRGTRFDAIDGLRAVSVAAVLAYHLELTQFAGGFLGVEVFFVISGFLITGLLIREHNASGHINLREFWVRRFRRLLPAVLALLLFVLVLVPFAAPDAATTFPRDVVGAVLYVSNWWQLLFGQSYFDAALRPPLLRHLWSLAVEEQFYLVWPLTMMLVVRLRRSIATVVVLVGAALSAILMWAVQRNAVDPTRAYVGTDTRASGLLIGASLAFACAAWPSLQRGRLSATLGGFAGLGVICWAAWALSPETTRLFPGGFLLIDVATVAAIIAATSPAATAFARLIGNRVFRWLGTRSYGLYLFHWPVFQMMRPRVDLLGWWVNPARIVISVLLAELSFRFIETPFRTRGIGGVRHALVVPMGRSTAVATSVVASLVIVMAAANVGVLAAKPDTASVAFQTEIDGADDSVGIGPSEGATPDGGATSSNELTSPASSEATQVPPDSSVTGAGLDGLVSAAEAPDTSISETTATTTTLPPEAGTVLTIGDSVMLGAQARIKRSFGQQVTIDAQESRSWFKAPEELALFATAAQPPKVLILHLGNNGAPETATLKQIIKATRNIPVVVLVTVSVPRRYETVANERIRDVVKLRPDVRIADWSAASKGHRSWFERDGFHLSPDGTLAYVELLRRTVSDVVPSVAPTAAPSASPTTSTTTTTTTSTLPTAVTVTTTPSPETTRRTRRTTTTIATISATTIPTAITVTTPPTSSPPAQLTPPTIDPAGPQPLPTEPTA